MSKRVLNSVWGVLKVLQQFAFTQEAWGPREIARATGLSKSTALRVLQTMVEENFLVKSDKHDEYVIGRNSGTWDWDLEIGPACLTSQSPYSKNML
jgi:DNA-binding IclR family transcriptional regulator